MSRLCWQSPVFRLAVVLASALAPLGPLACVARADDQLPERLWAPPELSFLDLLAPVPNAAPASPTFASYSGASQELLSLDARSPGLQFSVDPQDEAVFVGWQFEF